MIVSNKVNNRVVELSENEESTVSTYTFRPCAVDLEFSDIAYGVKVNGKHRQILSGLSGTFKHGKLHCIMGPSGAGKSSLLNVLAGFNRITDGDVIVNGDPVPAKNCSRLMSSISSYILQDDFLVAELTIRETFAFAARLKIPGEIALETHGKLIDDLLEKIGLAEVSDRYISRLSGGQRKRVAVGVELINYQPVIFLDEPTSGLDSTSTYRLVELLKAVASVGCNVIATIHQPNSRVFRMFDSLYVLASGGRLAYHGPPLALTTSLKRVGVTCPQGDNPADHLFEPGNIDKLAENWNSTLRHLAIADNKVTASITQGEFDPHLVKFRLPNFEGDNLAIKLERERQRELLRPKPARKKSHFETLRRLPAHELMAYCIRQRASSLTQFAALQRRCFLQVSRDRVFFIGRFVAYLVCTVIFGTAFQFVGEDATKLMVNIGYIYLMTMLPLVGTAIVTIMSFPIHFNVLLRENINSWYSVSAFYLTRAVVDNTLVIATAATAPNVMWLLSTQLQWQGIAIPVLTLVMCVNAMTTHHFAYIIAMGGDEQSLPFLPFSVTMLHTLFSGFMIPINSMPSWIRWTQYIYYGQFAYRATMRTAYAPLLPEGHEHGGSVQVPCGEDSPIGDLNPICAIKTGDQVLAYIKINENDSSIWIDIAVIAGYFGFFFIIAWILLIVRVRSAKRAIARA